MRWYERMYVGEKAKKHRFSILRAVRNEKSSGYYVLTPASNPKNLLDIYSAKTLKQPYYKQQDLLIVGVAEDYEDAAMLAGKIIGDVYKKTGGYDVTGFLKRETGREHG